MAERIKVTFNKRQRGKKAGAVASGVMAAMALISPVIGACATGEQKTGGSAGQETSIGSIGATALSTRVAEATRIPATGEIETRNSERAILNLGNWEIAIVGWEEFDKLNDPTNSSDRVNGNLFDKYVVVQTIARNISSQQADLGTMGVVSRLYQFELATARGVVLNGCVSYAYARFGAGTLDKPYLRGADGSRTEVYVLHDDLYEPFYIPAGLAVPVGLLCKIGKNVSGEFKDGFGLVVKPLQAGLPNPSGLVEKAVPDGKGNYFDQADTQWMVRPGEIAEGYKLLSSDIQILQLGSPVNAHLSNSAYVGDLTLALVQAESTSVGFTGTYFSEHRSMFDEFGADGAGLRLFAYLADGRVVELSGGGAQIPSGQTSNFQRYLELSNPTSTMYKPYNLAGATIVACIDCGGADQKLTGWRLP